MIAHTHFTPISRGADLQQFQNFSNCGHELSRSVQNKAKANMKNLESTQLNQSLLQLEALDQVRDSLTLMGHAEMSDALIVQVKKHAAYLGRCSQQAEAVLYGDLGAANRLWLLLKEPISAGPTFPQSILDEIASHAQLVEPRSITADVLLRLIAGVVRSAKQPAEADAMLYSLSRLLEPLFLCDLIATADERVKNGALRTLITAWWSPHWHAELPQTHVPDLMHTPDELNRPILNWDRVPIDPESWRNSSPIDEFPFWKFWNCPEGIRRAMSQIDLFGPVYNIESISNAQACSGQTITIRGRNFGPTGRVYFPSPAADDPAFGLGAGDDGILAGVESVHWTDTEIDVVVPPWATSGEMHLNAFTRHSDRCATIDVYRLGNTFLFEGGLATVFAISVAGKEIDLTLNETINLVPGDTVMLAYRATVGPSVRVHIRLIGSGKVLWERTNLPGGISSTMLPIPDPQEPVSGILELMAHSNCGETRPLRIPIFLSVPPRLTIQYVEVTQGVQGNLADVVAGRGMPTVANKDTAVRVHLRCDRSGWYQNILDYITGTLFVDGRPLRPTNVRAHRPDRGFASVYGVSNPEYTGETLNFTIPAAWLTPGTHALNVYVVCNDPTGRISAVQSFPWTWLAKSPLRVRVLHMSLYASDERMLDYARSALDFLPTPLTDIGIARPGWHTHTYDLSTRDGWDDLLDDLEDLWDDFDEKSGVRWLGIVSWSERFGRPQFKTEGIANTPGNVALAMEDKPWVGAHELAHSLGLNHVNQPPGVPDGPYDPVDNDGVLRRPPFDVRSSTAVLLPAIDLMGCCSDRVRPGPTTWLRLFNMNF